jgi:hypothetical protein
MEQEMTIECIDRPSHNAIIFIGARAGYKPTFAETEAICERTSNKRGDPMLYISEAGWDWFGAEDLQFVLSVCSGTHILNYGFMSRLLTVRTEWSRK